MSDSFRDAPRLCVQRDPLRERIQGSCGHTASAFGREASCGPWIDAGSYNSKWQGALFGRDTGPVCAFSRQIGTTYAGCLMELDRFDRQLLKLVQEDAGQTAERLADQVQLSPSAIQRRLRRMREEGVIVRECAVVDPNALGRPTFFIVSLQVESERPELLAQLRNWLAAEERVQQVFYVTGEADFVLVVTAADTESFEALMSRMLGDNPNVKRFTTNVAMSVVKRGLAIPVPSETDA